MDAITKTAIAKIIKDKELKADRKELKVGIHQVSGVFRIEGELTVAEDQEIAATASLLNKEFLALVLHHAGITREHAKKVISKVANGYLSNWKGTDEDKKAAKEAREAAVAEYDPEGDLASVFSDFANELPKVPRTGAVKFKGAVVASKPLAAVEEAAIEEAAVA